MESLVTQNVMHASLCHMTSVGAGGGNGWGDRWGDRGTGEYVGDGCGVKAKQAFSAAIKKLSSLKKFGVAMICSLNNFRMRIAITNSSSSIYTSDRNVLLVRLCITETMILAIKGRVTGDNI